ncbi:long-chain-fatty-acid--CoA ligase [Marinactinospora thermotolerans]|uniref:Long-chain acyl-CoA synthetase n=1 Tax=Marinactinospora thermotolerans DSM 45154 TaxID=1122192 RepID=A0A1T4SN89_9ACTN|nr:long-chain fatty acid--CoA ligase [Marinactinospora thermotolerans]SKA29633.1 long-chain acyl-CoA synthetase [Marinactinospora thermotolerans DSM 45154]
MLNLSVLLEDGARNHPDRDAVVFGDLRLNYALVDMIANQVAELLVARGIERGDRIAIASPNTPYFPFVYFGALKAGAVVVPLNVLLTPREIAYHLRDSGAKALFAFTGTPDLPLGERAWKAFNEVEGCEVYIDLPATPGATESTIEGAETLWAALAGRSGRFETVRTEADDTAVIIYTSGTTGQPKGAQLTHANLLLNAVASSRLFGRAPNGHDIFLTVLPLFHIFGQTTMMNCALYRQGTMVLQARFDGDETLALMEKEGVTMFAGVPTMYWGLLGAKGEHDIDKITGTLHTAVSGGSALPGELAKRVRDRFGVDILEGYGLSETSPVVSFNDPRRKAKPGSIGLPIWGVEMRLVDAEFNEVEGEGPGEIAVRGHCVMKGYHQRPEINEQVLKDGWFRTGDIARRDEEGFYYIVDRSKDMIIRGGYNVYPRELEEVLMTHPDVSLAAVVGVPHETHGEEIKAYVIRQEDARVTEQELITWAKERLAAYKYPRLVEFRDELPMTATGKILKRELR